MENQVKNSKNELDLKSLEQVLTAGVSAGLAIASFSGSNSKTGGIIGGGFALLVSGLLLALDEEVKS
jgi:uncharacterized membrane protein YgaE (UPF0421/DUF939 family)